MGIIDIFCVSFSAFTGHSKAKLVGFRIRNLVLSKDDGFNAVILSKMGRDEEFI